MLTSLLVAQTATAAQLLDVRTGESDHKQRMVLVSDTKLSWRVLIEGNELVMRAEHVQTKLPSNLVSLKASALGKIKISQADGDLVIRAQLRQPMRIAMTKNLPFREEKYARWLIDLEPDTGANRVAKVTEKTDKNSKNEPIHRTPIPAIVVDDALVAQALPPPRPAAHKSGSNAKTSTDIQSVVKLAKTTNPERDTPILIPESLKIQPFKGTRPLVIAIDAGHGGKDVGATSASGALEKDLTLEMAKVLKQHIDAQHGMRAVLTRDEDFFIPLGKRPRLARDLGADIFISLHADTYKDSRIKGASFYVMSWNGATSQLAKFVAAHSNSADNQAYGLEPWSEKLANDIGKLAMSSSIEDSRKLAAFMQKGMRNTGIKLQHSSVQAANFAVLKNIDMPSVLVEMGFISNPLQDKLLQDIQYQNKMAASIVRGLVDFAKVQPEPGVVYAKLNVSKGDSLASIAERHGTTAAYLARANGLNEKSGLKVGQMLRVPVSVSHRMAMVAASKG
jgi:N-acetylmuramoyl-L-alanine amidase